MLAIGIPAMRIICLHVLLAGVSIVLSREKPTAGNRFSLLFTVDNKPGKLGEVIQIIGASGFNMESVSYTHLDVYKRQPLHPPAD